MKTGKILTLIAVVLTAATLLCSCQVNTSSTDTKYKFVMVGALSDPEEKTVNGSVWRAIKAYQKNTVDETTNDKKSAIKYYSPAEAKGSDGKSYSDAFTEAAKKQLELAAAGGAELIILPSDAYAGAYLGVKDETKKYGEINFIILTVPGSSVANAAALNTKTTAVIINTLEYGYVFGYTLAKTGNTSVGFLGAEGKTFDDFAEGLEKGMKAVLGDGVSYTFKKSPVTSGPNETVISDAAKALLNECEVIVGDEMTQKTVEREATSAGKKYASIYEDDNAVISYYINCDVLSEKLASVITDTRQRSNAFTLTLGVSDGIFALKSPLSEDEAASIFSNIPDLLSE